MHIVTVFHSGYGHTRKLAEAFHLGLKQDERVTAALVEIDENGVL